MNTFRTEWAALCAIGDTIRLAGEDFVLTDMNFDGPNRVELTLTDPQGIVKGTPWIAASAKLKIRR